MTGNTVIDALYSVLHKTETNTLHSNKVQSTIASAGYQINKNRKVILITSHRRENFGNGFDNICQAVKVLAEKYTDADFVYPVHLKPKCQEPVNEFYKF